MTTATIKEPNHFLEHFAEFEKRHDATASPALRRLRNAAIARFAELGFPTDRDEDWKFTSLAALRKSPFQLPPADSAEAVEGFRKLTHGAARGASLLCMNGNLPFLLAGSQPLPKGVMVCSLAEALRDHADLVEPYLGNYADYKRHPFVALNTAFLNDGAVVYVPANTVVPDPIFLTFGVSASNDRGPYIWHRRTLIVLESGSQATVVERYVGLPSLYFTNGTAEVVLADNAQLDHYKLQQEGAGAYHLGTTQVRQQRSSRFSSHFVSLGGNLVRNEVGVFLDGEGCETTLNGLYMASGTQHIDNRTTIDHAKPHCASHELYKGILDGKAHGVFNGKIYVHQDAQKTDAKQTNQTLLLSDDAVINTKPQLEIFADDVKCTHGATVGQLDDKAIFYLRSRGIDAEAARSLLTFAFANDIIGRIKVASIRAELEKQLLVARRLPEDPHIEETI